MTAVNFQPLSCGLLPRLMRKVATTAKSALFATRVRTGASIQEAGDRVGDICRRQVRALMCDELM